MLLWINGPFGGGKTHVAAEIKHRLPGAWIADPELVGFGLHRMLPPRLRGDFQDMPSWRTGVVDALDTTMRGHNGLVIAPQTLVDKDYFAETIGSLRSRGHDVRHVTLMARPETVIQRLRDRGFGRLTARLGRDTLARESFAVERVIPYLQRLEDPAFSEHVWTDDLTLGQVADRVAKVCDVVLRPVEDGRARTALRRAATTVRHMRST